MTNALESLFRQIGMSTSSFPPGSRYYGIAQAEYETPLGEKIGYLRRRIIPLAARLDDASSYMVTEGDRLDNIAASHMGDPEQFWQIADFNNAIRPEELTDEPGKRILLP